MARGFDQTAAWIVGGMTGCLLGSALYFTFQITGNSKREAEKLAAEAAAKEVRAAAGKVSTEKSEPSKEEHSDGPKQAAGGAYDDMQWSYKGSSGPGGWANLDRTYRRCESGKHQSPVDIVTSEINERLRPIKFLYRDVSLDWINDGRTLYADVGYGSAMEFEGDRFELIRISLQTPSEHRIKGVPYEAELQLIHQDVHKNIAIVSIFAEPGKAAEDLADMMLKLPTARNEKLALESFDVKALLPKKQTYYKYDGSLSVPPCSEGVMRFVLTSPITIPAKAIDELVVSLKNNIRPARSTNAMERSP